MVDKHVQLQRTLNDVEDNVKVIKSVIEQIERTALEQQQQAQTRNRDELGGQGNAALGQK